uniref:Uncharacterized protein n=1 Tax=Ciona savignyi TaxID=51511 RepID=H2Y9W8_CIOSA
MSTFHWAKIERDESNRTRLNLTLNSSSCALHTSVHYSPSSVLVDNTNNSVKK